jgi:hypothetical protein
MSSIAPVSANAPVMRGSTADPPELPGADPPSGFGLNVLSGRTVAPQRFLGEIPVRLAWLRKEAAQMAGTRQAWLQHANQNDKRIR